MPYNMYKNQIPYYNIFILNFIITGVTCGFPGKPTNGVVSSGSSSHVYGTRVTYSCNTGWTLQGSRDNVCQNNGQWRSSVPTCKRTYTLHLLEIWNWAQSVNTPNVCQNNGQWRSPVPCVGIGAHCWTLGVNTLNTYQNRLWPMPLPYMDEISTKL